MFVRHALRGDGRRSVHPAIIPAPPVVRTLPSVRPDELGQRLRVRLDALGPARRAELLRILTLPDFERADQIGAYYANPTTRTFAELRIDCDTDLAPQPDDGGPEGAFAVTIAPDDLRIPGVPRREIKYFVERFTLSLQDRSWRLYQDPLRGDPWTTSGLYTISGNTSSC